MYGIDLGSQAFAAILFLFAHPVFLAAFLTLPVWPVTFVFAAWKSPNRKKLKWWLFMPVVSLAASLIGCLKTGLIFWIPALIWGFKGIAGRPDSFGSLFYFGAAGAASSLFSTAWVMKVDRELHAED